MKKIERKDIQKIIPKNGAIFGITFEKKNGELRNMSARLKVRKGVKGTGRGYNPEDHGLLGVYDMNKRGFRMVTLNKIFTLSVDGNTFEISDHERGI